MHTLEIGPTDILVITSERDSLDQSSAQRIASVIREKLALVGVTMSPDRILILSRGMNLMTINGPPSTTMEMVTVKAADLDKLTQLILGSNDEPGAAILLEDQAVALLGNDASAHWIQLRKISHDLANAAIALHRGRIPRPQPGDRKPPAPKNETHV